MDRITKAREFLNGYRAHKNIEVVPHDTYCPGVDVFHRGSSYVSQIIVTDDGYYVAIHPRQSEQAKATTRVIAKRLMRKLGETWELTE